MEDDSITIDELMQECGVAYRTAKRRLRAAGVYPCHQDKRGMRYPRAEAIAATEAGEDAAGHASARERLDLARAKREEYQLGLLENKLMAVDDAVREWGGMIVEARTRLLAIPSMGDTPEAFRPVLEARIRDALVSLSRWKPPGSTDEVRE